MKTTVCVAFILCTFGLTLVQTSKILVIPFQLYSHINLLSILGEALKDDGHEVWMLAMDRHEERIKKNGIIPLTYPLKREDDYFAELEELTAASKDGSVDVEKFTADPHWIMAPSRVCDSVMQNDRIMSKIEGQKFDLVVYDGTDSCECHLMVPYKFNIPFVTFHGFQVASWVSGVTGMPSIEPEIKHPFSNRMDFWQRLENLKSWLKRVDNINYDLYTDHHMNNYCPANKPKLSLKTVAEMSEMYFMSFEVMCLDYPRVSAPNMQYLGATSGLPSKPLPEDLETYISGAEHGVIVMSLGSMKLAQFVWKLIGPKMFEAFARVPQQVIVQYRLDEVYGNVPDNVKLMKWLPQNDILGHKNVKLFITHGGNNGQNEAVFHGVPMLVVPLYVDQMYNAKRVEAHTYGKLVPDKAAITSDELYQMMSEIITNKTYSQNIKKCSEIIKSMPSGREKFVFWVNHILRFGGAHLRPPSLDMPLYQVLMLDIVAYYVIYYLVMFQLSMFVLYLIVKNLLNWKNQKAKKD